MNDIEALQDAFLKADALAQQGDAQAREDAAMFAAEIRRMQSGAQPEPQRDGFMAQLNTGIADTLGGAVDMLNPFDAQTGSAATGLRNLMDAGGIRTTDEAPEGFVENFARGSGDAAAALPLLTTGAGLLSRAPGMTGKVFSEVSRGLNTKTAALIEPVAGGLSRGAGVEAEQATAEAGYPEWAQATARNVAEVAAPVGAGAAIIGGGRALGAASRGAEKLPVTGAAVRGVKSMVGAVAPMTPAGARQQAREQLLREVGSEGRAVELGERLGNTELNLTPAQQTGDPNLLSMERAAADENPMLRERLVDRDATGRDMAVESIDQMSGNVEDARAFFNGRLAQYRKNLSQKANQSLQMADEAVDSAGPRSSESNNSSRVVRQLKSSFDDAKGEERALWASVPKGAQVQTSNARSTAARLFAETPEPQKEDIPGYVSKFLGDDGFGDTETVANMHSLYSKLREVARAARAGTNQQRNKARIADEVADAILEDLGAIDGATPVGKAINNARAYSAAMHETYDQGTVGRILNRTIDGDERITPEAALKRTVGRGGVDALVDARNIREAAPTANEDVSDYLRGRFTDAIFAADGTFQQKQAATWLRNNRELLNDYPGIKSELERALKNRANAEGFAARAAVRADLAKKSAIGEFTSGQAEKAVSKILTADAPSQAARSVVATARKDTSGKALDGVKAAFTDYLIGGATKGDVLTGPKLKALLGDPQMQAAMRQVFDKDEFARFNRITTELAKMDAAQAASPKGPVMDSAPRMVLDTVARVAGARAGVAVGGGGNAGVSLQAAQLGSRRATDLLNRLTNDRARQILYDAIEDPTLMRALLLEPKGADMPKWATSKLTPYLAGAASQQTGAE